MTSVGEDFPNQVARICKCLEQGLQIGPAGRFYVAVCKEILARADEAAASGDVVLMIRSYKEMKEFEE